ncbi:MAG: hypothetical protein LUD72_06785, partial [Bacteroidales bacterium]|nr:hypothetical protein [Bacteroidales bacterium]
WDALGREWKFQKDVSISGPDSEKTELGTPILHCNTWKLALMVSGHSDLTRKNSGKHTTAAGRK